MAFLEIFFYSLSGSSLCIHLSTGGGQRLRVSMEAIIIDVWHYSLLGFPIKAPSSYLCEDTAASAHVINSKVELISPMQAINIPHNQTCMTCTLTARFVIKNPSCKPMFPFRWIHLRRYTMSFITHYCTFAIAFAVTYLLACLRVFLW